MITLCRAPQDWVDAARALDRTRRTLARVARRASTPSPSRRALRLVAGRAGAPGFPRAPPPYRPASGLGWIGVLYGTARASTLLTQLAAGRLLGPEEYGRANLVIAAAAYLQIIPMLGFPLATSKLIADERDEGRRARLVTTALASFFVWAVLSLPLLAAAHLFLQRAMGLPAALFSLCVLLAVATAFSQVLASPLLGLKRFAHRGLVETVYGFSAPVLLGLCIFFLGRTHRTMILAFAGSLSSSAYAL